MTCVTLQMAADDPGYGAALAARLTAGGGEPGSDSALLREYLRACPDDLRGALCGDDEIRLAAGEHARAWGGAGLASRLEAAARTRAGGSIDDDVLLAAAVAMIQGPAD